MSEVVDTTKPETDVALDGNSAVTAAADQASGEDRAGVPEPSEEKVADGSAELSEQAKVDSPETVEATNGSDDPQQQEEGSSQVNELTEQAKSRESLTSDKQKSKSRESLTADNKQKSKSRESLSAENKQKSKSRESLTADNKQKSKSRESLTADNKQKSKSRESLTADNKQKSKSRESLTADNKQKSKSRESLSNTQSKENVSANPAELVVVEQVELTESHRSHDHDQAAERGNDETDDIPKPPYRICDKDDEDESDDVIDGKKQKFVLQGKTFRNTSVLKYRIRSYSRDLDKNLQNTIFARAFKMWSEVTNLNFKQVSSGRVAIEISFHRGHHGDGDVNAFDGAWGVLAHAAFGGDIHFDEDEQWTHESYRGVNLLQVAVHEIGHSLGLRHSKDPKAIMFASYKGYDPKFALHADDIAGIQRLYGVRDKDADDADNDEQDTSCCLIKMFRSMCKK